MVDQAIKRFGHQFGSARNKVVASILYYPHPLTKGGLILVFANEVGDLIDLIGETQQNAPDDLSLHCLRHRELFQLSLPGVFAPPFTVNERPHLPYFLNQKGEVLFGQDLRRAVQPAVGPDVLLAGHIEGCMDSLRRYGILPALMNEKYNQLAAMLEQEMLHLMSTALLMHNQWDINMATLPKLFWRYFPDERLKHHWQQLIAHRQQMDNEPAATAYHLVWLFERFLSHLESYVP